MSKKELIEEMFLKEPDREFHIREVARKLKCAPTTATKYLEGLEKRGFLAKNPSLGHILYKANRESSAFKNSKLHYNLNLIRQNKLVEHLQEFYNEPEAIILFGSFASAEDSDNSDIDITVITPKKTIPDLSEFENRLGRQIQIIATTTEELKKNNHLANKVINGIVLQGYWNLIK